MVIAVKMVRKYTKSTMKHISNIFADLYKLKKNNYFCINK